MTLLLLVLSLSAAPRETCAAESVQAQMLSKERKWLEASRLLLACAQDSCDRTVRADCLKWRAELEERIPSVLVVVQADGADALDAEVELDGAPIALDGTAVPVNPGSHLFTARRGSRSVSSRVLAIEREKGRRVVLALEPEPPKPAPPPVAPPVAVVEPAPSPPPPAQRKAPWGPVALGAAGLVGLGAFIGLGVDGKAKVTRLSAAPCAETSTCSPDHFAGVRGQLVAADVALGLGVALLIAAVVWGVFWWLG